MSRLRFRLASLHSAAATVLLAVWLPVAPPTAQAADLQATRSQLQSIQHHITQAQQQLERTGGKRSDARQTLRNAEQQLADTHQRIDQLESEQHDVRQSLDQLQQQQDRLQSRRQAQQQALAEQMRALYQLGDQPRLKMLLDGGDPTEMARFQRYLNRLNEARGERLHEIGRLDQQLSDNRRQTEQRQQQLKRLLADLHKRQQTLDAQRQSRAQALANLDQRYQSEQGRLADLQSERQDAEALVDRLERKLAKARKRRQAEARRQREQKQREQAQQAPSSPSGLTASELAAEPDSADSTPPQHSASRAHQASGRYASKWPVAGRLIARFGQGDGIGSNGVLIAASAGTPVHAVAGGQVVFAHWMRSFGNLVIIDHEGVLTLYAHNQRLTVATGDRVERGAVIARVGDSGGQSRPALYFEVRRGGKPIDPDHWLTRR